MSDFTFRGQILPSDIRADIDHYVQGGVPLGSFLEAVMANDLQGALRHADDRNIFMLPVIGCYIHNEVPHSCHGSYEAVAEWIARKERMRKAAAQ